MDECIDALVGNRWFSNIDANAAYWQVPLSPEAREKTAFRTRLGLFEFTRLPFGLANAPSTYSRVMDLTLKGLHWKKALAFLDDVMILGRSEEDHLRNIEEVLGRFQKFGLKLKITKCRFFVKKCEFLGRQIGTNGVTLSDHSVDTISSWPVPQTVKETRGFLGLVNFHRAFISKLADIAEPLHQIVKKENFSWGGPQQLAFDRLKSILLQRPVLSTPNKEGKFILDCDCSHFALGGELLQIQQDTERTIAYSSFTLSTTERKYCVTRKELLSVVRLTHHFRHYLLGRPFEVRTDHSSLQWLVSFRHPEGQLARWIEILSAFDMTIRYRQGKLHTNADALSRIPTKCPRDISYLPCQGCSFCSRVTSRDLSFQELDDTSSLRGPFNVRQTEASGIDVNVINEHLDVPMERMRASQREDPNLKPLLSFLESGQEVSPEEVAGWGPAQKFYYNNKEAFFVDKTSQILYFNDGTKDCIVVPEQQKEEVMSLCHDPPMAGHFGIDKTKWRVKQKFFWFRMAKDIKSFVKRCPACNIHKHSNHLNRSPRVIYQAGQPMQKVHLDFLGPLPKTENGNQYILVITDNFSKWVEGIPLPCQEAEVTAHAAVTEFFCRFGCPLELITDQGSNFTSALFKEVCRVLDIHKTRTTAYRPSANGQVERVNRSLLACLRNYVNKTQNDWDLFLPLICAAIRATVNRRTGYTPNMLMLGREVTSPADLVYPGLPTQGLEVHSYVEKLKNELVNCHEEARTTLDACVKREKNQFDKRAKKTVFLRADPVYYLDKSPSTAGKSKKLRPVWKGPGIIVRVISPDFHSEVY